MAIWAQTLVSIVSDAWALRRTSPRRISTCREPPYHIPSHSFPASTQSRWKHWKTVLKICLVCMISDESDFCWIWDSFCWKDYLFLFPCICRTYQTEGRRHLGVNFKARWSCTPNCNRGEIWELQSNPCPSLCPPPPNLNPKACYLSFPWYKKWCPPPCPSLFPKKTQQPPPPVMPFSVSE
jgi:hypothetical protein